MNKPFERALYSLINIYNKRCEVKGNLDDKVYLHRFQTEEYFRLVIFLTKGNVKLYTKQIPFNETHKQSQTIDYCYECLLTDLFTFGVIDSINFARKDVSK